MPAIGSSNPNPLPIHGSLWFDVRQFGAVAGNSGFDNAPAIQAAVDAAKASIAAHQGGGFSPSATVFIPGATGPYYVQSPIYIDGPGIEVRGEGSTSLVEMLGGGFSPFVVGLTRDGGGTVPGSTYRPDLWNGGTPKLDSTVVTGPGQRFGARFHTDG